MYYIEKWTKGYTAFWGSTVLNGPSYPMSSLAGAIQVCEDHYHRMKWENKA
jgi:hypothetical protein